MFIRPNIARIRTALSQMEPAFQAMVARLRDQPVYVAPMEKGPYPVITVHRQFDPQDDAPDKGYYFSERAGRDSVAFLLFDARRGDACYGVLTQWHGPLHRFNTGAYTGSMDKAGLTPAQITQEEVAEEAGFAVEFDRIHPLLETPVSGQCNEMCHLFLVDVTGLQPQTIAPENTFEKNARGLWFTAKDILNKADWKAKLILIASNRYGCD